MDDRQNFVTNGQTFAGTVSRGEGDGLVGAILFEVEGHDLTAITAVVDGRRHVVGMELMPSAEPDPEKRRSAWASRMARALDELPAAWNPAPLRANWLRQGISVREVLRLYAEQEARVSALPKHLAISRTTADGETTGLADRDLGMLDSLLDAVLYVSALAAGRSPAADIAKHRTISKRTAEGRIRRARHMGLLTPAVGRRAAGELTPMGEQLLERASAVWPAGRTQGDV